MKIRIAVLAGCLSALLSAAGAYAQSGVGIPSIPVGIDHDDPAGLKAKSNKGTLPKQKATGNSSRSHTGPGAGPKKQGVAGTPIGGIDVGLDGIPGRLGKSSQQKDRVKTQR